MRKVIQSVKIGIVLLLQLTTLSTYAQSTPYNPQLQITSNVDGYIQYNTSNTPSNTAHFYLFGDGFFNLCKTSKHQFEASDDGYSTSVYFNKSYDPSPPTLRSIATDTTEQGSIVNNKVAFSDSIHVGTSWAPVKGLEHYFVVTFENKADTTKSGCIEIYVDSTKVDLEESDILIYDTWVTNQQIAAVSLTDYNKKFSWDFANLAPAEQRHIYIPMKTYANKRSILKVGSKYSTSCTSAGGAGSIGSSSFTVKGSPHDPNTKTVSPECLDPGLLEAQTLHYTIHFQNEGNAFAHNVIVKDILHPFLDTTTFQITGSEYPCVVDMEGYELEFIFTDINLPGLEQEAPDTYTYDQTESWVSFSICTYPVSPNSPCVHNSADIYFDNQPAIKTNMTLTCVSEYCPDATTCTERRSVNNQQARVKDHYRIYPNPTSNQITIESQDRNSPLEIQIFDILGNLIHTQYDHKNSKEISISLRHLIKGVYVIGIQSDHGYYTHKIYKN